MGMHTGMTERVIVARAGACNAPLLARQHAQNVSAKRAAIENSISMGRTLTKRVSHVCSMGWCEVVWTNLGRYAMDL